MLGLYECVILCECMFSLSSSYLLLHYYYSHHLHSYTATSSVMNVIIIFFVFFFLCYTSNVFTHRAMVVCMRLKAYHVYILLYMQWTANSPHRHRYFGYPTFSQACNVHKSRHTFTLGLFSRIFFRLDNRVEYSVTWTLRRNKIFRKKNANKILFDFFFSSPVGRKN